MNRIGLIGLMKLELPGGDVRLCDAGFIVFNSETYANKDALLGTIGSVDALSEGVGDEVPVLELSFLPPASSVPGDLAQPGWQTARARFWIGEYDGVTGGLTGTPDLMFYGQLDRAQLTVGRSERSLGMSIVSLAERLFELNIGNSLSDPWHQSVWPGELGHVNATGLTIPVAWGAARPAAAATVRGGGGDGFANERGLNFGTNL